MVAVVVPAALAAFAAHADRQSTNLTAMRKYAPASFNDSANAQRGAAPQLPIQGHDGMRRWVGLGVISDNFVNIGQVMSRQAAP
jgi:hypothetical protein